jgi:hypothetical protein
MMGKIEARYSSTNGVVVEYAYTFYIYRWNVIQLHYQRKQKMTETWMKDKKSYETVDLLFLKIIRCDSDGNVLRSF